MVSDDQLAVHPGKHASQILPRGEIGKEHRVLRLHRVPVRAMHVRVVEIIAIDAPCFVENLAPLGSRIDLHFDLIDSQLVFRRIDLVGDIGNRPSVLRQTQQHSLPVARQFDVEDLLQRGLFLPFREAVVRERSRRPLAASDVGALDVVQLTGLRDLQRAVRRRRQRKRLNTIRQAIHVDHSFRWRLFRCSRLFVSLWLIGCFCGVIRFLLVGRRIFLPLFVALFCERRDHALRQDSEIDRVRRARVVAPHRETVGERTGVGRHDEVEILSVRIEHRAVGLFESIGERKRFLLIERVELDRVEVLNRVVRICDPFRIGRPRVIDAALHHVRRDLRRGAARDIEQIER